MKTRIDLGLLLPEAPDASDACIARLTGALEHTRGVEKAHVVEEAGATSLCLHYDAAVVTLAQVERTARQTGAEITSRYGHATFPLRLIDGEDAVRRVEGALRAAPGVLNASASLPAQIVRVEWDRTQIDGAKIERTLEELRAAPSTTPSKHEHVHEAGDEHDHEGHDHAGHDHDHGPSDGPWLQRHKELVLSLVSGGLLAAGFFGEMGGLARGPAIGIYAAAYLFGGWDLASHWVRSLVKGKFSFDIDLLMLLAAIGAAILGNWVEGAFLLFLFSLAHSLEHLAMDRARGAIRALSELTPDTALVKQGQAFTERPISEVHVGDIVLVHPGERIPVDEHDVSN
ncbi:heavy metal translocating P-type ATPase, partial [bacterium]